MHWGIELASKGVRYSPFFVHTRVPPCLSQNVQHPASFSSVPCPRGSRNAQSSWKWLGNFGMFSGSCPAMNVVVSIGSACQSALRIFTFGGETCLEGGSSSPLEVSSLSVSNCDSAVHLLPCSLASTFHSPSMGSSGCRRRSHGQPGTVAVTVFRPRGTAKPPGRRDK